MKLRTRDRSDVPIDSAVLDLSVLVSGFLSLHPQNFIYLTSPRCLFLVYIEIKTVRRVLPV